MPSFRLTTPPLLPHLPLPFHRRRRPPSPPSSPLPLSRPVYIYPGLLRLSARRAVRLDSACPASLYVPSSTSPSVTPRDSCAVCLDIFVPGRELVRSLPCSHVFHSRCILPWVVQADRCPLCNEAVLARGKGREETAGRTFAESGKGREREESIGELPDVTPSTLCVAQQKGEQLCKGEDRMYSFVLHDQARFAHLLER